MWKNLFGFAIVAGVWYHWSTPGWIDLDSPLAHAVTFSAADTVLAKQPVQTDLGDQDLAFTFKNYRIKAIAGFEAEARVLSRRDYRSGREAELSPIDLALGWGPMSRDEIVDQVDISQRGRFYYWRVEQYPIPHREIVSHSANMHMIPGSRSVEQQLREIDADDIIRFKGYLVRIEANDGWRWQSSLTRTDSGPGACEIVLVESISRS